MRRVLAVVAGACMLLVATCLCMVFVVFPRAPSANTSLQHFDTLIVLGAPASPDGGPSPDLRERVDEAVREYRAGIASHMILSGGPAHNRFVEAEVMAARARSEGVPASAIVLEPKARNTIQNIWYSRQIMLARHWQSAEVISSEYHLPRAALILQRYRGQFAWRVHAARWPPEHGIVSRVGSLLHEGAGGANSGGIDRTLHSFCLLPHREPDK